MIATQPCFWTHLRRSGLLTDEQVAGLELRFASDTPVEQITSTLVDDGLLTPFQTRRIAAGDSKHLVLGQYRVTDLLGRGGFGCVYKATHAYMNRTVAIKVISPDFADDSRARTWFEREILALTQFSHPNIVMAYDANEIDGLFFLVMEYVDGVTLEAQVRQDGPLSPRLAGEILQQAARGLQYAHEKGIVHRDIKPANLLVPGATSRQSGEVALVKIADFGLARLFNNPAATLVLRNEKSFVGTPDFIAPEQARKVHQADIRSDLYSLGCTFYFALTGLRPFRGENALETIMMHSEKEAMPLRQIRNDIPPALAAVIQKLMAKDPDHRFQTPADLAAAVVFAMGSENLGPIDSITLRMVRPASQTMVIDSPAPTKEMHDVYLEPLERLPPPPTIKDESISAVELVDARLKFSDAWPRWTAVIDALAAGSTSRIGIHQYRSLYNELLSAARVLKASRAFADVFEKVEALVRPWLSADALANADRAALRSLQQRCAAIARELGIQRRATLVWPALLVVLALVAAGAGYVLYTDSWQRLLNIDALTQLLEANPLVSLVLVIPVAVAVSGFLLGRMFRSPRQ